MNLRHISLTALILCSALAAGCAKQSSDNQPGARDLVGQWRTTVQFNTGAFSAIHDLEFMYVFNSGGTMTESSNYDVAPPVPPAYGIWKKTGADQFEAKYEFFLTKPLADLNELTRGSGWLPAGHGVLTERITLSVDGNSYSSTIRYDAYDQQGKPLDGGGDAIAQGIKLKF